MAEELEKGVTVIEGTGNVFADLNLPSSEEDMLKIKIAHIITAIIKKKNLTQTEAAEIIGTDQAKVSKLLRGQLKGFSADRLIRMLVLLNRDIDIRVSEPPANRPGRICVKVA